MLDHWGIEFSFLESARFKYFCLSCSVQTRSVTHPASRKKWLFSPRISNNYKKLHSAPPYGVEDLNPWIYILLPSVYLNNVILKYRRDLINLHVKQNHSGEHKISSWRYFLSIDRCLSHRIIPWDVRIQCSRIPGSIFLPPSTYLHYVIFKHRRD
jgi:hypothetical protein